MLCDFLFYFAADCWNNSWWNMWMNPLHRLWRPHTVSRERAAHENSLIDQDAEGGFHHSLLPCTQTTVARRRSRRWGRGGGGGGAGGALGCYPGDDGFFHAGDDHGVPEPSQPSENTHTHTGRIPEWVIVSHVQRGWLLLRIHGLKKKLL